MLRKRVIPLFLIFVFFIVSSPIFSKVKIKKTELRTLKLEFFHPRKLRIKRQKRGKIKLSQKNFSGQISKVRSCGRTAKSVAVGISRKLKNLKNIKILRKRKLRAKGGIKKFLVYGRAITAKKGKAINFIILGMKRSRRHCYGVYISWLTRKRTTKFNKKMANHIVKTIAPRGWYAKIKADKQKAAK